MLLYLAVFVICLFIAFIADNSKDYKVYWFLIGILILFLSIIAGFRDFKVGIDTQLYIPNYWAEADTQTFHKFFRVLANTESDKGFLALNKLAHVFGNEIWLSLFFTSLFIYGFAFVAGALLAKEYKFKFTYFVFFYLFIFFNTTMNHMRQHCAVSIMMIAFYMFIEKRYVLSSLFFLLSTTFHSSSIVILGLPVVHYLIYNVKNVLVRNIVVISTLFVIIISVLHYYEIITYLSSNDIIYELYADRYGINSKYEGSSAISIPKIIYLLIPFLFYWNGKRIKSLNQKDYVFFIIIQIIFLITYSLQFISIYLFRLGYYYQFIQFIACSKIVSDKNSEKIWNMTYMGYIVLLWYFDFIYHGYHGTYPYTSKILGL